MFSTYVGFVCASVPITCAEIASCTSALLWTVALSTGVATMSSLAHLQV